MLGFKVTLRDKINNYQKGQYRVNTLGVNNYGQINIRTRLRVKIRVKMELRI